MVNISNNKEKTKNKKIIEYIKPQIICIPLENKFGVKYKHQIKEGDYIYKGSVVAVNEEDNFPVHSSVSGYVISGTQKVINNGKKIKCIIVENDFKEKYSDRVGSKKNINDYSKKDFIKMLKEHGITGLGGSDFPTFLKYQSNDNFDYLLVNGVECEPFITCDNAVMMEYCEEILDCIDAILEIMKIKRAYIVLKENNEKVIREFAKYIGSYPNILMFGIIDEYPNGWERTIVKEVLNIEYDRYPSEKGVLVSNVSTIYAIYEMLKYNRPLTERIITITGEGIKKPCNVRVKIGALMSEIINQTGGYKELKKPLFIAGGAMMGVSVSSSELVVTKDLSCVIVMENNFNSSLDCIKCGKCINVCPAKIMPVLIMDNIKNEDNLRKLKPERCIECGLCSYICPSRIEVREIVKNAKDRVK